MNNFHGMSKRITILDLAERLNTTPSTISRALRDHPGVSKSLREAAKSLARELNYQPNSVASGLRKGKSHTIGIVVPHINRDFFSNVISGIEDIAFDNGYKVMICQSHDNVEKEIQYINTLVSARVDGIIVSLGLNTEDCSHFDPVLNARIPLIFFDRVCEQLDVSRILNDDIEGSYKAVSHLVEMGYKRIAYFSGPDYLNVYRDRKNGYLKALKNNSIEVDDSIIIQHELTREAGWRAAEKLMQMKNRPDAIFSSSDYAALGALLYLRENNINVPAEVGIAGFSNEKFTSLVNPSLTTVDQHSNEIGTFCAKQFLEEVELKNENYIPRKIILNPRLIIRESTMKVVN
jgi:LacI family transcriptional regulator